MHQGCGIEFWEHSQLGVMVPFYQMMHLSLRKGQWLLQGFRLLQTELGFNLWSAGQPMAVRYPLHVLSPKVVISLTSNLHWLEVRAIYPYFSEEEAEIQRILREASGAWTPYIR